MGFDPQWAFRDCKWCGAHDVQMQQSGTFVTAGASHPGARSWTALSCPRCASLTIVERNAERADGDVIDPLMRQAISDLTAD